MPLNVNETDIHEKNLLNIDRGLVELLLKDKTTGKNLIWATDNYNKYGSKYFFDNQMSIDLIITEGGSVIKPRVKKSKAEQEIRSRQKAEVFTPSWVVNAQNNLVDDAWFGRKEIFNRQEEKGWKSITEKIFFSEEKSWTDYVSAKRMEVSCGEAPYITSRYDATNGEFIEVQNRIGFLDRKLRVVNENTESKEDWLKWSSVAVQSVYGFDWQGDNVFIARENVLLTVAEHYSHKFGEKLESQDLIVFAKIIAWNIWQMDGLKFVVPNSCSPIKKYEDQLLLFEELDSSCGTVECEGCKKGNNLKHTGIYCKIKDWEKNQTVRFVDMVAGEQGIKC